MQKKDIFLGLCFVLLLTSGQAFAEKEYTETRTHMGTYVTIRFFAQDLEKEEAQGIMTGAFEMVAELDGLLSTYKKDSVVSKINREAFKKSIRVDDSTYVVLERSLYFARLSGGAFDISVGPLVDYWRGLDQMDEAPEIGRVKEILKSVGFEKIKLSKQKSIRFENEGMKIDLGGIAKGYAADIVVEYLKARGVKRGLVNLGGDMTVFGGRPGGAPWRVGVQNPFKKGALLKDAKTGGEVVVEIADGAVVTSGNYERFFLIKGKKYSHIIDPKTGWPSDAVPSVTIVAPSAMDADALATAVSVLGTVKGMALVEKLGRTECLIIEGLTPSYKVIKSSGMDKFLAR